MRNPWILLLLFGLSSMLGGGYFILTQPIPGDYVETEGNVEQTAIKPVENQFYVKVLYSYKVGEKVYQSVTAPQFDVPFATETEARSAMAQYWEGKNVPVFYEKDRPEIGTLKINKMHSGWLFVVLGFSISLIGFLAALKKS